ncbi:MAG: DUF493 domain-containing protein [Proteobacteria bacterium]|jgi:hypothetical protein|nr:DUF493 domain-containing protein [Pseudomonadota bacterium]
MSEDTLLTFPCEFPIKIMGRRSDTLEEEIIAIVRNHAPDLEDGAVRRNASSKGNYLAITVTLTATSKQQLDNIYLDLNAHEAVVMTL